MKDRVACAGGPGGVDDRPRCCFEATAIVRGPRARCRFVAEAIVRSASRLASRSIVGFVSIPRRPPCQSCWTERVGGVRPPRPPSFTRVARQATRASDPADPPKVEAIIAVMRAAGDTPHGLRLRGLIVILGEPVSDSTKRSPRRSRPRKRRGSLLVRRGKGGRRREVGSRRHGTGRPSLPSAGDQRVAIRGVALAVRCKAPGSARAHP